jgi:hypothetical protein
VIASARSLGAGTALVCWGNVRPPNTFAALGERFSVAPRRKRATGSTAIRRLIRPSHTQYRVVIRELAQQDQILADDRNQLSIPKRTDPHRTKRHMSNPACAQIRDD